MDFQIRYLALLVCSPFLALVLHIVAARAIHLFKPDLSPLFVAVFAILLGYAVMGRIAWQVSLGHMGATSDRFWAVFYGVLVYSGLAFSYFQLFAMTETARRIKILYELALNPKATRREVNERYGASTMLAQRLERLVEWRQLRRTGGRYVLEGRFLYWIAKIAEGWTHLLKFLNENSK